ncbi:MAG: helix-turn-helix domain-containing protein [Aquificales bacterium]|nr:helix-turn-helix domain-containing protein [Aquificales bacterium]
MTYDAIGLQIKKRRLEMDMTARELARRTGLSASFISQLERGKTKVSLESLRLIAENLDVSILHFLSEDPTTSTQTIESSSGTEPRLKPEGYDPVVRADKRPQLTFPDSGVSYELLTLDLSRSMESICGRLAPGTGNIVRRLRMPTEEFIYVLSGALMVGLKSGEYVLNPGDTIYFEGAELMQLICASEDEDAVWVSVITPPAF